MGVRRLWTDGRWRCANAERGWADMVFGRKHVKIEGQNGQCTLIWRKTKNTEIQNGY